MRSMVPLEPQQDDSIPGKIAVVAAYIFMILTNALSFTGLFGSNIADISNDNPTYVTPDGLTFSIWGVIYLLELVLTVAQSCDVWDSERFLGFGVRYRIALAFVLNGLWLPIYCLKWFPVALAIITAYLVVLVSILLEVNGRTVSNVVQYFVFVAPIAANASWLVVATAANFFAVAGELGWKDQFGVAGTVPAAVAVVVLATALAASVAIALLDLAWPIAAAWALRGLWRMHTFSEPDGFRPAAMSPWLATVANWGAVFALIAAEAALLLALYIIHLNDGALRVRYEACGPQATPFVVPMQSFPPRA